MRPDLWNTAGVFGGCFFRAGMPVLPNLEPSSLASEHYRSLALTIGDRKARTSPDSGYVLAVTSADPDSGKTLTSINLAAALAGNGERPVLLLEGDVRQPRFQEYFEFHHTLKGLYQLLTEDLPLPKCLAKPFGVPGLEIMTAGVEGDSGEILLANPMNEALAAFKQKFDIVVIDLPPYLLAASQALTAKADGVLIVVRADQTPPAGVEEVLRGLGPEKILGFVLNGGAKSSTGYEDYYLASSTPARRGRGGLRGKLGRIARWSAVAGALLALGLFVVWLSGRAGTQPADGGVEAATTARTGGDPEAAGGATPVPDLESADGTIAAGAASATRSPSTRTTERLNLRISPALDSRLITTLARGTELEVLGQDDEWRLVRSPGYDGLRGWVHYSGLAPSAAPARATPDLESRDDELSASTPSTDVPSTEAAETARTIARFNLRLAPRFDGRLVTTLAPGTELDVVETQGEWYRVRSRSPELEGWMHYSGLALSEGSETGLSGRTEE